MDLSAMASLFKIDCPCQWTSADASLFKLAQAMSTGRVFSSLLLSSSPRPSPPPPPPRLIPSLATFELSRFSRTTSFSRNSIQLGLSFRVECSCNYSRTSINPQAELGAFLAFFQELGLNDQETELILRRNRELRSTSIDSVRARVASLKSVGIDGFVLSYLIAKRPFLLTSEEITPVISFLTDELEGKLDPAQLKRLFIATEPVFLMGFDEKVNLLIRSGVPKEKIVHVLNNVNLNKALCHKPTEQIERLVNFVSHYGGIDLIVRRPAILNCNLDEQLVPRVEFLLELSGGDEDATRILLRKLPAILSYSVEHMSGHVQLLKSAAGLDDREIFSIMLVFPGVISASKGRKLYPRIDFLKQSGLNSGEIFKFLTKAPLLLGLSFRTNLACKLGILVKIGYRYKTKELAVAMGAVTRTSCENLQKVISLFLSYGFSCADIVSMSKKHPQILQYNPHSLEEKIEYLIWEMGRELEELLSFPAFLGYGLDRRIKQRYEMKKRTAGKGMSLNKLLSVSTERFTRKSVREPALNAERSAQMVS